MSRKYSFLTATLIIIISKEVDNSGYRSSVLFASLF
jgi:hypothetical protein